IELRLMHMEGKQHGFSREASQNDITRVLKNMEDDTELFSFYPAGLKAVRDTARAFCEVESGIPASESVILFEGRPLLDSKKALKAYGIKEGDVLVLQQFPGSAGEGSGHTDLQSRGFSRGGGGSDAMSNPLAGLDFSSIQIPSRSQSHRGLEEEDPAVIRDMFLADPTQLSLLKQNNPHLADALTSGDLESTQTMIAEEEARKYMSQLFQGSRSSEDCQLMWKNLLHPSINKKTWTEREEDVLVQLAASGEDWDTIAESLRTNRTGFQCCVRFQRLNKAKSQAPWTPEESQKLLEVVEMCRFTSRKIPWSTVAAYMEGRTPEQLCRKYKDQIRQECAKGKFSHSEDIVLMACVEKFRTNFSHMTSFFRSRSVTQLQERYRHLRCRVGKRAAWTRKEDDLLLDLVNNSGVDPNWDIIADELTGRDAVQCRGRFSTIYNHLKRMPVLPPGNEQLAPTQNLIGGYTFDELRKEAREHVEKAEAIVQENASLNGFVVTAKDVIEQVIKSLPNIKPRTKIPKRPTVPARRGKVDEDLDSFFATSARRSIGRPRYLTNEALTERFKVFRRLLISLGLTKFIKPNSLVEILEHSPMEVLEGVNFDIISNSEQQSIPMSQFAEWWVKESGEEPAVINSEGTWFPLPMTLSSLLAFRAILLHRRRLIKYIQESKLRAANESRRKSRPDASQIPDVPVMTQGHALKLVIEKMDAGPGLPPVVKVIPPKGVSQDLITKALSNKHLMSKILAQKGSSRTVIVLHPGILQGAPTMNPASQRLDGDAAKNLFLQQFLSLFAWPAYLCRQNPMLEIFEVEKRRKPGHITRGDLLEGLGPLIERMDQAQQGSRSHKIHVLSTAVPKFKRAMLESDAQGQSEDRDCPPKKRIRISTPATRVRESRRLKAKNQVKMLPEGSRSPLLDSEEVEPQISDMNLDPFS
ncbi:unnamed protein product, partial [Darwinula stevensoni]